MSSAYRLACATHEVGVRREVRVVGEDVLAGHVRGQLDEQALVAQADVQRVEDLRVVEALRGQVALAKRRHPKVDERARKFRTAQAARMS